MSDLQRRLQGVPRGLPPRPKISSRGGGGVVGRSRANYNPIPWSDYWDTKEVVTTYEGKFCVYSVGEKGGVVVVCLHGGGYSALTWSILAKELVRINNCRVVAVDLRGHGETTTKDDTDLSGQRMAKDIEEVLGVLLEDQNHGGVVLVGHSMGGALAVQAGEENIGGLCGLVVIDVVEGTALDALASMQGVLQSRPDKFGSVEQAVEWCVRSGQVRNVESARVSMPGQVINSEGVLAASLVSSSASGDTELSGPPRKRQHSVVAENSIKEEGEDEDEIIKSKEFTSPPKPESKEGFRWRINLMTTERHWSGWFTGLSQKFLSSQPSAKLLLLAGVDRLDKDLTVGQMQGKFQMQVLPQVGHTLHEDSPERVAEVLATFLIRHKLSVATDNFSPPLPGC